MTQWLAERGAIAKVQVLFSGGQNVHRLKIFDIVNFVINYDAKDRRPSYWFSSMKC